MKIAHSERLLKLARETIEGLVLAGELVVYQSAQELDEIIREIDRDQRDGQP